MSSHNELFPNAKICLKKVICPAFSEFNEIYNKLEMFWYFFILELGL